MYSKLNHFYKAVLVAVISKTGKDKSSIVRAISEVLKTMHNRSGPYRYRMQHPEEVQRHAIGDTDAAGNIVVDFGKKSVKSRVGLLVEARPSTASVSQMASDQEPPEVADSDCRPPTTRPVVKKLLQNV